MKKQYYTSIFIFFCILFALPSRLVAQQQAAARKQTTPQQLSEQKKAEKAPVISYNTPPKSNLSFGERKLKNYTQSILTAKVMPKGAMYYYEIFADNQFAFEQDEFSSIITRKEYSTESEARAVANQIISKLKQGKAFELILNELQSTK